MDLFLCNGKGNGWNEWKPRRLIHKEEAPFALDYTSECPNQSRHKGIENEEERRGIQKRSNRRRVPVQKKSNIIPSIEVKQKQKRQTCG